MRRSWLKRAAPARPGALPVRFPALPPSRAQLDRATSAFAALAAGGRLSARGAEPFCPALVSAVVRHYCALLTEGAAEADAPPAAASNGARGGGAGKGGAADAAGAEGAGAHGVAAVEALCVRLNSAAFVRAQLASLDARLAAALARPADERGGDGSGGGAVRAVTHAVTPGAPGGLAHLAEPSAECERAALRLAGLIASRVVHAHLADLWPRLYARGAPPALRNASGSRGGKAAAAADQGSGGQPGGGGAAGSGVGIAAMLERLDPLLGAPRQPLPPRRPSRPSAPCCARPPPARAMCLGCAPAALLATFG